jgi:hypothetical protein
MQGRGARQELRRAHGLHVQAVTETELAVSLTLSPKELFEEGNSRRVSSVLAGKGSRGGSVFTGGSRLGTRKRTSYAEQADRRIDPRSSLRNTLSGEAD